MANDTTQTAAAETQPQEPAPVTVESLEAAHPDLIATVRSAARAEGVAAENKRIQAIEAVALPGHGELLTAAKKDVTITPEAFMQSQIQAEQRAGASALSAIRSDEEEIDAPPAAPSNDVEASQPSGNGIGAANPAKVQRILNAGKKPKR